MSRMLISKKGTKPGILVVFCIILAVVGGLMFLTSDSPFAMLGNGADFARIMSILAPIACIVAAIFVGATAGRYGQTYINIYDDHIEGFGLLTKGSQRGQNFHLPRHACNVTVEGNSYICVRSDGANYYMHFDAADVQQIMACVNGGTYGSSGTYEAPKATAEAKIFTCPNCGAKCRVPGGKGNIRVRCPRCSQQFNANT